MIRPKTIKKAIAANSRRGVGTVFLEPRAALDEAIVAVAVGKDGKRRMVYDIDRLAQAFVRHDEMTAEEAYEWIGYNTERAIPYMAGKHQAEPKIRHRRA